jgi:hypothetical protein
VVSFLKATDENVCHDTAFLDPGRRTTATAKGPDDSDVSSYLARVTRSQITPETPCDTRYRDRRLLALYFDMTAMSVPEQLRALTAAEKFIRNQMTPADVVALMEFESGAVKVLQDFTGDRELLLRPDESLRDARACSDRGVEQSSENGSAQAQRGPEQSGVRPVRLPGNSPRPQVKEGRILASPGHAGPLSAPDSDRD